MGEVKTRVLVVDAKEDLVDALRPLTGAAVEIARVGSAVEALAVARSAWDVVVLDLGLPGALDALRGLLDEDPCCPVVVTSSPGGPPPGAALDLGAVRVVEQPASPADVAAVIGQVRVCQSRRLRIELRALHLAATLPEASGKAPMTLAPEALRAIRRYSWPGGSAEILEALTAAVASAKGPRVELGDLPAAVRTAPSAPPAAPSLPAGPILLDDVIRHHVVNVFLSHHENVTRTARALGISRVALRRRLREYGLKAARVD